MLRSAVATFRCTGFAAVIVQDENERKRLFVNSDIRLWTRKSAKLISRGGNLQLGSPLCEGKGSNALQRPVHDEVLHFNCPT